MPGLELLGDLPSWAVAQTFGVVLTGIISGPLSNANIDVAVAIFDAT